MLASLKLQVLDHVVHPVEAEEEEGDGARDEADGRDLIAEDLVIHSGFDQNMPGLTRGY